MIRRLIRRLALAALDCGPSTLRHALEGDADARRVLVSQGVTPYDLTAIADARAARRRDGYQPRPKPVPDPVPLTPPPMQSGVEVTPGTPGLVTPLPPPVRSGALRLGPPGGGGEQMPEPAADDCPVVLGPWKHYEEGSARVRLGGPLGPPPLLAFSDEWLAQRWDQCMGTAILGSGSADDIDDAFRKADAWAREQGWVLLDAEPGCLRGSKVTLDRTSTGQLCRLEYGTIPPLHAAVYKYMGWAVQLNNNTPLARGPQTGAEGERLLRAALTALGVEVLDG